MRRFIKTLLSPLAVKVAWPANERALRRNPAFSRHGTLLKIEADGAFGPAGTTLLMMHDWAIFPFVGLHSSWSPEIVDFFARHANASSRYTLVDIGANIGLITRQLAHRLSNIDRIVCVEPDPENFRALKYNLTGLPGADPELHNLALSAEDGEVTFFRDVTNSGNYSLNEAAVSDGVFGRVRVACADTGGWMERTLGAEDEGPLLWKSDTQGFDELIISRTPMAIWKRIDCAAIEIWRIPKPAFDRDAFVARIDDFPHKRLGTQDVTTDQLLTYLDGDDRRYEDLFLWR